MLRGARASGSELSHHSPPPLPSPPQVGVDKLGCDNLFRDHLLQACALYFGAGVTRDSCIATAGVMYASVRAASDSYYTRDVWCARAPGGRLGPRISGSVVGSWGGGRAPSTTLDLSLLAPQALTALRRARAPF